jgi:hypothetical protein
MVEMTPRRRYRVPYSEEDAAALWHEIQLELGTAPRVTSDPFRRAMALFNFFANASRRRRFGIGVGMPEPEIWPPPQLRWSSSGFLTGTPTTASTNPISRRHCGASEIDLTDVARTAAKLFAISPGALAAGERLFIVPID